MTSKISVNYQIETYTITTSSNPNVSPYTRAGSKQITVPNGKKVLRVIAGDTSIPSLCNFHSASSTLYVVTNLSTVYVQVTFA